MYPADVVYVRKSRAGDKSVLEIQKRSALRRWFARIDCRIRGHWSDYYAGPKGTACRLCGEVR